MSVLRLKSLHRKPGGPNGLSDIMLVFSPLMSDLWTFCLSAELFCFCVSTAALFKQRVQSGGFSQVRAAHVELLKVREGILTESHDRTCQLAICRLSLQFG